MTATNALPLTRGRLSKRTGCHLETIRYYERIGLIRDPPRRAGGHRLYERDDLKRLTFICRARDLGFSLDKVRGLLALVDGGNSTCAEVKAVTLEHAADVRRRVRDLRKIERVLKSMADQCNDGRIPDCPIIDTLFEPRQ